MYLLRIYEIFDTDYAKVFCEHYTETEKEAYELMYKIYEENKYERDLGKHSIRMTFN